MPEPLSAARPRQHTDPASPPITADTYERLVSALESVYPGRVRRTIEVTPVAITKTIDNETDALETIRRIEERAKHECHRG